MADPGYTLHIKQALAIKPKDFRIRVVPRQGRTAATLLTSVLTAPKHVANEQEGKVTEKEVAGTILHVLYGGNTGTCEGFAQRLATDAAQHGE